MDIFEILEGRFILNYIGGTLRYIYGSIWRTIFNKPKFTYKEYIYGPKKPDYYDEWGHEFNNRMIAGIFLIFIFILIANYFPIW
ncbi:hypothetical protein Q762_14760 [Flavobacterium cauense R2A-7]|uniref:hypothetical protein n=1 Tax=Flavobacterium cauense TaxID=510946 RepID=UPI00052B56E9|nr:hypothetical protein [Flavobacterium cauense]KGO79025.1 hypothetical protein Q762_14760 [Flavobacterium cauense R2A-7]